MRNSITIRRPERPIDAVIELPRSKSVSNRALILAAHLWELEIVQNMSDSDDTRVLFQLLREKPVTMNCGAGGTTFRFLLAWACTREGEDHFIGGDPGLLARPHEPLIDALRHLGAQIERVPKGYHVLGKKMKGGSVTFDSPISSQYISALLLIAPEFEEGLRITWTGRRLSEPYVKMTIKTLLQFGACVERKDDLIVVHPTELWIDQFNVPPDWSAASFWYSIAALSDHRFTFPGLYYDGWQGDQWASMLWVRSVHTEEHPYGITISGYGGALIGKDAHEHDLADVPDLFQPLAISCAAQGRTMAFTGLHNLSVKETDRLAAVADALTALGVEVDYADGTFNISGRITNLSPPPFDPRGDHRMAMALAPLALVCDAITILDPEVVSKSYPAFWDELRRVGFSVEVS